VQSLWSAALCPDLSLTGKDDWSSNPCDESEGQIDYRLGQSGIDAVPCARCSPAGSDLDVWADSLGVLTE
jgi:hypothetical protein